MTLLAAGDIAGPMLAVIGALVVAIGVVLVAGGVWLAARRTRKVDDSSDVAIYADVDVGTVADGGTVTGADVGEIER